MLCPGIPEKAIKSLSARNKRDLKNNKGCLAKGKGVSSRASLLISVKVLVGNVVTTGHHARAVSPDYLLNEKKRKRKSIKIK
jgi:hypothetical protein